MTAKTISLKAFTLLKKYMQMTLSGSETEKAFALQKATEVITETGIDWNHILDRCVKVELEIEPAHVAEGRSDDPKALGEQKALFARRVDEAFVTIEASDPRADAADFIDSLKDQWDRRRSLSELQLRALFKFEANAQERMERRR